MEVLCFDIGSGGAKAARFDERLQTAGEEQSSWDFHRDADGRATLSPDMVRSAVEQLAEALQAGPVAAVSIGCFMHSFAVLSSCCAPLTPIFTWLDSTAEDGVEIVKRRFGSGFHERTGCRYHPLFPVFKLAASPAGRGNRVASPKALLLQELTGEFVDDPGMSAASGLLNARTGLWDPEILHLLGLELPDLPAIADREAIAGKVTLEGSSRYGVRAGTPVVNGSGDGFLANIGSGCERPDRIAVTVGTSAVARQMVAHPVLDESAGTFCYRAALDSFLLGCASSNGGNALDWARQLFGGLEWSRLPSRGIPIFMPWLNGERSLEWNPGLRASWHGLSSAHGAPELLRAVLEGVVFNLAQYIEVIERASGIVSGQIVLSGNGFRERFLASLLGALVNKEIVDPDSPGLGTLRGAAVCAWRALGHDPAPAIERLISNARPVLPAPDEGLTERYLAFKALRSGAG